MRSLPKDNCLGPVPVDISDLIEKKVNFDESHLVNKGVHNDTLCSHKGQFVRRVWTAPRGTNTLRTNSLASHLAPQKDRLGQKCPSLP